VGATLAVQAESTAYDEPWKESIMTVREESIVRAGAELSAGEEIEAWRSGRIFHRGNVTDPVPDLGLFWIMDPLTGGRKLLDMAEVEIVRVPLRDGLIPSESGKYANTTHRTRDVHWRRPTTTDVNGREYVVGHEIL
jgi:hypothetical protein